MGVIIHRSLSLNTAPAVEVFTTADDLAKAHCRISTTDDDALLTMYIKACRRTLEKILGLSFIQTTWDEYWDDFPVDQIGYDGVIELYRGPVNSIDAIAYIDAGGANQTLNLNTAIQSDLVSRPARILPAYGTLWPVTRRALNAVKITYKAGFGTTAASVPEDLKHLLALFIAIAYEERLPITGLGTDEVPVPVSIRQLIANNSDWGF